MVNRLNQLQRSQKKYISNAFFAYIAGATSSANLVRVRKALTRGRDGIMAALETLDPYMNHLGNALTQVYFTAGTFESKYWSDKLVEKAKAPRVAGDFDVTERDVVSQMRRAKMDFLSDFRPKQRAAIRAALIEGVKDGMTTDALVKVFKENIGLTPEQRKAVKSYQRTLERGSAAALDRTLRDRRFDRTVQRVIDTGDVLTGKQIERMVGRYTENMLRMRADMIARTEMLKIIEEARETALKHSLKRAKISEKLVVKEWISLQDEKVRETHMHLDGQKQPLAKPFRSISGAKLMRPGDRSAPASEVINCRCSMLYHIMSSQAELREFLRAA